MPTRPRTPERISGPRALSQQARSTTRLAIAAVGMVVVVAVVALTTRQARRGEATLDQAVEHTLRDYTGYAARLMGSEVLRRFSEQRTRIFAPVTGGSTSAAPPLDAVVERAQRFLAQYHLESDSGVGYFKLDLASGRSEVRGTMRGAFGTRVLDSIGVIARGAGRSHVLPDLIVMERDRIPYSVAYASTLDASGRPATVYGFTYTREAGLAGVAREVFHDTPLLPTSFAGERWNYDTTTMQSADVGNDSLLAVRISDRQGRTMWQSSNASILASSQLRERVVISTYAGGIIVEAAVRPSSETSLIPQAVRSAQRWSLTALLVLAVLLTLVSLYALGRERVGARARRAEAMQQLALGLRHELNNALASVMLNAELLQEDMADPSQRERLDAIVEQADRMRSVLRRLEKSDRLDNVVPYLNEGLMVDLSESSPDGSLGGVSLSPRDG